MGHGAAGLRIAETTAASFEGHRRQAYGFRRGRARLERVGGWQPGPQAGEANAGGASIRLRIGRILLGEGPESATIDWTDGSPRRPRARRGQ